MHKLKIFEQTDTELLYQIIRKHSFATLIVYSENGVEVDHLPMFLAAKDDKFFLQGHLAKVNPTAKQLREATEVMIIFHGPNAYISPNFYPTKQANGKAVPTWNYIVVHVKGMVSAVDCNAWKLDLLDKLTAHHEIGNKEPWSMSDAPTKYIEQMLPAIIGIEIEIQEIEGKWKVSQDKPKVNQQGVVQGLQESGHGEMSDWVNTYITK
ncbi:FMN-binding negative transcriptional regulator [Vibrio gangliei]|uniref:FMN-binding negative transcriptional regulator n=1 Tax=Vibrio gangliei TaxID=2077090 RepID=UPI000D0141C8|nr:FMN-binding negative transcriptional regulator [Vibrio gangliei]